MIEKILVGLAVGILQYLAARRDQRNAAQAEVYREAWNLAKKAYEWEVGAAVQPGGGTELRVREGAGTIELQSDRPDPQRPSAPPSV